MKKVLIVLAIVAALVLAGCGAVSLEQDDQTMEEDELIVLAQDIPAESTTDPDAISLDAASELNEQDLIYSTLEDLVIPRSLQWDENYPLGALPLFPEGNIELTDVSDHQITYRSDYSLYDVTVYYFDILVASDDFKIVDKTYYDQFFGTIDGYYFEVTCTKEDTPETEQTVDSTLITVVYSAP